MPGRTVRATLLAGKLAAGLAAAVPDEVEVSVADSVITVGKRGTPWRMAADLRPSRDPPTKAADHDSPLGVTQRIVEWDPIEDEDVALGEEAWRTIAYTRKQAAVIDVDSLEWTLEGLLDQFQDEVAETIAEPWPAIAPDPMPEPFVQLRPGRLVAGYGRPSRSCADCFVRRARRPALTTTRRR
jgi:hypothetical protein